MPTEMPSERRSVGFVVMGNAGRRRHEPASFRREQPEFTSKRGLEIVVVDRLFDNEPRRQKPIAQQSFRLTGGLATIHPSAACQKYHEVRIPSLCTGGRTPQKLNPSRGSQLIRHP